MTGQNKSPPQHTPGPWHANIHGQVFSESDHIGNVIGSEANARLIARAPELLEKLEALIERADDLQAAIEGLPTSSALPEAASATEKVALAARASHDRPDESPCPVRVLRHRAMPFSPAATMRGAAICCRLKPTATAIYEEMSATFCIGVGIC